MAYLQVNCSAPIGIHRPRMEAVLIRILLFVLAAALHHGSFGILGGEAWRNQRSKLLQLLIVLLRIQMSLAKHEKQLVEAQAVMGTADLIGNLVGIADQHVGHFLAEEDK